MPLRLHTPILPLRDAVRWLNSSPVDVSKLRGRPVLVHFMAQSCRECEAQLPRVREWARQFAGRLHVITVHTPIVDEDFDPDRVEQVVRAFGLVHPIAFDGDEGDLAEDYQVRFTPAYFLFGADGTLRHYQAGVGAAEPVSRAIDRALTEAEGQREGKGVGA